jgi:hypothetical protein
VLVGDDADRIARSCADSSGEFQSAHARAFAIGAPGRRGSRRRSTARLPRITPRCAGTGARHRSQARSDPSMHRCGSARDVIAIAIAAIEATPALRCMT